MRGSSSCTMFLAANHGWLEVGHRIAGPRQRDENVVADHLHAEFRIKASHFVL